MLVEIGATIGAMVGGMTYALKRKAHHQDVEDIKVIRSKVIEGYFEVPQAMIVQISMHSPEFADYLLACKLTLGARHGLRPSKHRRGWLTFTHGWAEYDFRIYKGQVIEVAYGDQSWIMDGNLWEHLKHHTPIQHIHSFYE